MPRTGGIYSEPAGTKGTPNTTIQSAQYNSFVDDLVADANAARPVTAGGTGSTNATDARVAIGADNASNLTQGTVADARLPGTMSAKIIQTSLRVDSSSGTAVANIYSDGAGIEMFWTGGPYIDFKNAAGDDFDARIQLAGAGMNTLNFTTGASLARNGIYTIWDSGNDGVGSGLDADVLRGFAPSSVATPNSIAVRGGSGDFRAQDITATRGDGTGVLFLNSAQDRYIYYNNTSYNLPGAPLTVGGGISAGGSIQATSFISAGAGVSAGTNLLAVGNVYSGNGNSWLDTEGNLRFSGAMASTFGTTLSDALAARVKNDGGTYAINISGGAGSAGRATYLRNAANGADMAFSFSGQAGQPSWLWGSNDGINMLVWSPANFSVNYANSAGNANTVGGIGPGSIAQFSSSGNINETNFPLGQMLSAYVAVVVQRRAVVNLYLSNSNTAVYVIVPGDGSILAGAWVQCGTTDNNYQNFQRYA